MLKNYNAAMSSEGMVATSQIYAAEAGASVLNQGGNAADAAIAAAAMLSVTEPCSCGLGGDCFVLYYQSDKKQIFALNGSGRSPQKLNPSNAIILGLDSNEPDFHADTITVPGAVQAWYDLNERFGTLPVSELLIDAIDTAHHGFEVGTVTALQWQSDSNRQLKGRVNNEELLINGRAPQKSEKFVNPTLANTLELLAEGGVEEFYRGKIAKNIVETVQSYGGILSISDMASHKSTWEIPISTIFRGKRIFECPPNGQGLVALLALKILNQINNYDFSWHRDAKGLHSIIESCRLAFTQVIRILSEHTKSFEIQHLLNPKFCADTAKYIQKYQVKNRTFDSNLYGSGSDTAYVSVVDRNGNACSLIQSNYDGFGTGIIPKGCGFTLQNRGACFSCDPNSPNFIGPNKRPYHTIMPGLALNDDGSLYSCFGLIGGFMQPQGHVQILTALNDGLDPQQVLDLPRMYVDPFSTSDEYLFVENEMETKYLHSLASFGHKYKIVNSIDRSLFGRGQVIVKDSQTGNLLGGSDRRIDGGAIGI